MSFVRGRCSLCVAGSLRSLACLFVCRRVCSLAEPSFSRQRGGVARLDHQLRFDQIKLNLIKLNWWRVEEEIECARVSIRSPIVVSELQSTGRAGFHIFGQDAMLFRCLWFVAGEFGCSLMLFGLVELNALTSADSRPTPTQLVNSLHPFSCRLDLGHKQTESISGFDSCFLKYEIQLTHTHTNQQPR